MLSGGESRAPVLARRGGLGKTRCWTTVAGHAVGCPGGPCHGVYSPDELAFAVCSSCAKPLWIPGPACRVPSPERSGDRVRLRAGPPPDRFLAPGRLRSLSCPARGPGLSAPDRPGRWTSSGSMTAASHAGAGGARRRLKQNRWPVFSPPPARHMGHGRGPAELVVGVGLRACDHARVACFTRWSLTGPAGLGRVVSGPVVAETPGEPLALAGAPRGCVVPPAELAGSWFGFRGALWQKAQGTRAG